MDMRSTARHVCQTTSCIHDPKFRTKPIKVRPASHAWSQPTYRSATYTLQKSGNTPVYNSIAAVDAMYLRNFKVCKNIAIVVPQPPRINIFLSKDLAQAPRLLPRKPNSSDSIH